MRKFTVLVKKFVSQEEGATMVEYGLMVALIAVFCIVGVQLLGTNLLAVFNNVASQISPPAPPA